MKKTELVLVGEHSAVTYRFKAKEDFGWANATVDEAAASLQLNTDWGDWTYRWNYKALGDPSLHAFIGNAHYDYLANKLLGGSKGATRFSAEKTANNLKKLLLERRLEDGRVENIVGRLSDYGKAAPNFPVDRYTARGLWDDIDQAGRDMGTNADAFFLSLPDTVFQHITDYPYDCYETETSPEYVWLCEIILPPLAEVCRLNAHKYKAGIGEIA